MQPDHGDPDSVAILDCSNQIAVVQIAAQMGWQMTLDSSEYVHLAWEADLRLSIAGRKASKNGGLPGLKGTIDVKGVLDIASSTDGSFCR